MGTNKTKPYKIQEDNDVGRVGVTAVDLKDLRRQAVTRLNIPENFQPYLDDGTAVLTEEYFQRLEPQTCFTFRAPYEDNVQLDFLQLQKLTQKISKKLAERQDKISEKVKQLLSGENSEVVNRALLDYISSLDSSLQLESRQDDSEWFNGLHGKYQTKEAVMKDGAKTRIKNYYQKTREYLLEKDPGQDVLTLLDVLRQELRLNDYNSAYFARSAEEGLRICDKFGWFKCEGKFADNTCAESHSINPYGSKEARIVFSTWNLDHVVEKSREVLPTLAEVVKKCPKTSEVNWQYFYNLLFTKKNLKLVHVACHIKGVHVGKKCDKKQFYNIKKQAKKSKVINRGKWTLRSRK